MKKHLVLGFMIVQSHLLSSESNTYSLKVLSLLKESSPTSKNKRSRVVITL